MQSLHKPIKAIVGLGNPGPTYLKTRHNAGAWFVDAIAKSQRAALKADSKLLGLHAKVLIGGHALHLLIPSTFMNRSGASVAALCQFFKIDSEELLIAHDELDFPAGKIRLKFSGGHGGHNGLRDSIKALNGANFHRLRIGIGHPGEKSDVSDYVLKAPSKQDRQLIDDSLASAQYCLEDMLSGNWESAMQSLHTLH